LNLLSSFSSSVIKAAYNSDLHCWLMFHEK
jgi:hypothetical protein